MMTKHSDVDDLKDLIGTVSHEANEILKIKCMIIKNKLAMYINQNPYQSLGAAAVIGLMFGLRKK